MTWWTVAYLGLAATFLAVEGAALFNRRPGDTLSEHFWRWLRVRDPRPSLLVWILRGLVLLFCAWLGLHLTLGWFTPTHPWPF
jgi:hypothetical protein